MYYAILFISVFAQLQLRCQAAEQAAECRDILLGPISQ
jgi:hypothetical protein